MTRIKPCNGAGNSRQRVLARKTLLKGRRDLEVFMGRFRLRLPESLHKQVKVLAKVPDTEPEVCDQL